MRTGTRGASSPCLTSCRPLCSPLQVSMLLTLSPRCSIFLHLHPQFLSTSGRRHPPLLSPLPAAGSPASAPSKVVLGDGGGWGWSLAVLGAQVGIAGPRCCLSQGYTRIPGDCEEGWGTFHGDTPPQPHSGSVWNAGFAGPWALGWVKLLGCDAPQDKSPFLILPQFTPRSEHLQCCSQRTQSGQTPDMLPTTSLKQNVANHGPQLAEPPHPLHLQQPQNCSRDRAHSQVALEPHCLATCSWLCSPIAW